MANYRQTVLTAFGQVEDNLAAQRILVQDLQQQQAAVQSAQRYVKQATSRNLSGLDPYLNVLTAQVDLLTYQQTYVTFQTQQMLASVQLIEALGADGIPLGCRGRERLVPRPLLRCLRYRGCGELSWI